MGKICRNCHESKDKDLISPCMCEGNLKWVHRSCLDTWRTVSPNFSSFSQCDICKFEYRVQRKPAGKWPRILYALKMIRDILTLVIIALAFVLIAGGICLLVERLNRYDKDFDPEVRDLFENVYFQIFVMGFLAACFVMGILAILFFIFKSCGDCCNECCAAPTYKYNTYSYNSGCDAWWCLGYYWWTPRYSPPGGTCCCFDCCMTSSNTCFCDIDDCCCCFTINDCCCCCNGTDCDCDCANCDICECIDCLDCGGCDCDGDAAAVLVPLIIIVVIIIIIIGFFAGLGLFVSILSKFAVNHNKIYKRQLDARELQIVDLSKYPEYINDASATVQVVHFGNKGAASAPKEGAEMDSYPAGPDVSVPTAPAASVPTAPPGSYPPGPADSYPAGPNF